MSFCVYLLEDCNGFGYIGSTCNLKQRLKAHKKKKNNACMSKILTQPYSHLVLEEIEDEDNLEFAEQFYIKLYKSLWGDKLLNKIIPLRTRKEYLNENREKIKEYVKEYNNGNRERMKEYRNENRERIKEYRNENRERIKQKQKEWYIDNKEKIKEHNSQIIDCECGSKTTLQHKSRHLKSQKHINFTKQ